jgi:glycosyltransferase involved in cell wall biosynthesis
MGLNILYHHRTQGRGAEGHHIASIVRELQALGHRVTVLSPPGIDPLDPVNSLPVDKTRVSTGGIQSIWKWVSRHLPNSAFEMMEIGYNLVAYWRMRRELKSQPFDLVYERYAFYLVAGAMLARRHRVPFVLEVNEVSGIANRARIQSYPGICAAFERFLFARCTAIHAVSSYLKERVLRHGVSPDTVCVASNAFSLGSIAGVNKDPALTRQLGLEGSTVIGFAGWFDAWDHLDALIRIFAGLRRSHRDIKLLLIGDGPASPELKLAAAQLQVQADVVFTGAVPRSEIYRTIALIDIAVLPHSNDFGSPVVMFEFMGLGVPVVAPKLAPILDVHRDGETALLFTPLDEEDCRRQIECLILSQDLRAGIGRAARDKLLRDHTWQQNAERILASAGLASGAQAGPIAVPTAVQA